MITKQYTLKYQLIVIFYSQYFLITILHQLFFTFHSKKLFPFKPQFPSLKRSLLQASTILGAYRIHSKFLATVVLLFF